MLGYLRRGIDEKRQQVYLGIPEIVSLVSLTGEALRRHTRVLRACRSLQDVKKIEADRLLDLNGGAFRALFPNIPYTDVAASPEVLHVLRLRLEQLLESPGSYPIQRPLSATTQLFGRRSLRAVIDHVLDELERTAAPCLDAEGNLAEILSMRGLAGKRAGCFEPSISGARQREPALVSHVAEYDATVLRIASSRVQYATSKGSRLS